MRNRKLLVLQPYPCRPEVFKPVRVDLHIHAAPELTSTRVQQEHAIPENVIKRGTSAKFCVELLQTKVLTDTVG